MNNIVIKFVVVNICCNLCAYKNNYRIDMDTIWRFVYIACIANDSLHEYNGNIARWCLSHWYWCIWFPYKRYWRLGRWGFRLCNGLWWFHILNEYDENELIKTEKTKRNDINQPIWIYSTRKTIHLQYHWVSWNRICGSIKCERCCFICRNFFLFISA